MNVEFSKTRMNIVGNFVKSFLVDPIVLELFGFESGELESDIFLEVILSLDDLIEVDSVGKVEVLNKMMQGFDNLLEFVVTLFDGLNLLPELEEVASPQWFTWVR